MGLMVVISEAEKSKGLVAASAWASGQGCLSLLNIQRASHAKTEHDSLTKSTSQIKAPLPNTIYTEMMRLMFLMHLPMNIFPSLSNQSLK